MLRQIGKEKCLSVIYCHKEFLSTYLNNGETLASEFAVPLLPVNGVLWSGGDLVSLKLGL